MPNGLGEAAAVRRSREFDFCREPGRSGRGTTRAGGLLGASRHERDRNRSRLARPASRLVRPLCRRGYRPVPLYNGAPGVNAAVPVGPIINALDAAAESLKPIALPPGAPPAFLLDLDRFAGSRVMSPGVFDNRWWAFPQDFPSANLLLSRGFRTCLLIQPAAGQPHEDLAHVLLRYQQAGLVILSGGVDNASTAPITIAKPSHFRRFWYRALVLEGLRRNSAGGFGAVIPVPGSGGFG